MRKKKIKNKLGDIIQIKLPNGKYAYGRSYKSIEIGIYNKFTEEPNQPPIGLRDFLFYAVFETIDIENGNLPIVGNDHFFDGEDEWGPPRRGMNQIFHRGEAWIPEDKHELDNLPTCQLYSTHTLIIRIMNRIGEPLKPPEIGIVFQIDLLNNKYAYGRLYKDRGVGVYKTITDKPGCPPIGEREFLFYIIWFNVFPIQTGECKVVGNDPFVTEDEAWPPPTRTYLGEIRYKGKDKKVPKKELKGLEEALVWELHELADRVMKIIKGKKPEEKKDTFFDDDIAFFVKQAFLDFLEEGMTVKQITKKILDDSQDEIESGRDGIIYVALALLQLEQKKLQPEIKEKALASLETGKGLEEWEGTAGVDFEEERKEILENIYKKIKNG